MKANRICRIQQQNKTNKNKTKNYIECYNIRITNTYFFLTLVRIENHILRDLHGGMFRKQSCKKYHRLQWNYLLLCM